MKYNVDLTEAEIVALRLAVEMWELERDEDTAVLLSNLKSAHDKLTALIATEEPCGNCSNCSCKSSVA
jgi:predicted DNA-binding transcriptional regulator YafY